MDSKLSDERNDTTSSSKNGNRVSFHDLICIDHHALNFIATGGPFPFPILCIMHDIHLACRLHGVDHNWPFVHLHLCKLLLHLRLISRKHQINGDRAVFFQASRCPYLNHNV
jgi:hypothetical protein